MKIILSEEQIHKLREDNPDFIIAPYPTPEEYQYHDPEGYKRSKALGTLDLFYPNRPAEPQRGRGRPPKREAPVSTDLVPDKDKLYMSNLVKPDHKPKRGMGRPQREIKPGMWVSTHTEDFKVISIKHDNIIGKSFCDPDKVVKLNPDNIIDFQGGGRDKVNKLKMDFTKYYEEAGLNENDVRAGRDAYLGGQNVILFLDDLRNPFTSTTDWIKKHSLIGTENINVVMVQTYKEFATHIENVGLPKQIIFDHDLGNTDKEGGDGCLSAAWLVKYCVKNRKPLPKWSISSANKYGRCCIGNVLRKFEELSANLL